MMNIFQLGPWFRGGVVCTDAGYYAIRHAGGGETHVVVHKEIGYTFNDNCEYSGPFQLEEGFPALTAIPGCRSPELKLCLGTWRAVCLGDDSGMRTILRASHKDRRTAIEAYNAAAKILAKESQ